MSRISYKTKYERAVTENQRMERWIRHTLIKLSSWYDSEERRRVLAGIQKTVSRIKAGKSKFSA